MKHIKKIITMLCVMIILCSAVLTGCKNCIDLTDYANYEFETDGTYYYHLEENGYYVAGLKDETQEVLYIPAYFNGEFVVGMGVFYSMKIWVDTKCYSTIINYDLKKIYYPYTMDLNCSMNYSNVDEPTRYRVRSFSKETFFTWSLMYKYHVEEALEEYYDQTTALNRELDTAYAYVTRKLFEHEYGENVGYSYKVEEIKSSKAEDFGFKAYVQIANTAYFFNYEEAPNEGYFFINNFEYGGLIENTPYKPIREGYEFAGWYKEPECVNKWDFEKDKLHEEEYDEEGNFVFEELGLYAKWTKK